MCRIWVTICRNNWLYLGCRASVPSSSWCPRRWCWSWHRSVTRKTISYELSAFIKFMFSYLVLRTLKRNQKSLFWYLRPKIKKTGKNEKKKIYYVQYLTNKDNSDQRKETSYFQSNLSPFINPCGALIIPYLT